MNEPRRPARAAGEDGTREHAVADAGFEDKLLELVRNWMRKAREAASDRTEAAIDRASFESFPASDPVAPAAASTDREPALEEVDCTMECDRLVFRCAPREPDAHRAPPAWTLEGRAPDGGRMLLRVWIDDTPREQAVPQTLTLEPVHASIRARQHERRSSAERRVAHRSMPAGFDRRRAERRIAGGGAGAPAAA